jgi:capsular exopolysaccharide synthesis family protein
MYEIPQQLLVVQESGQELSMPGHSKAMQMEGQTESSLLPLISSLRRHVRMILGVSIAAALLAFLISKRITPAYEATATLEVSQDHSSDLLTQTSPALAWSDADQYIATQIRVLQEDSVLRPVAEEFGLLTKEDSDPNAPIVLKGLHVVRPPSTYLIQVSYRSSDPVQAAAVANGITESYLKHVFRSRLADRKSETSFMEQQLDEVRAEMERSAKAVNDFETKIGVVDSQEKTNIVSARLLQLNTEYTTAQADRIKKQADYIGLRDGSLSAAQQSDQSESLKQIQRSLDDAQQKFIEVKEHFGVKHPEYHKQAALVAGLQAQLDDAKNMVAARARTAFDDATQREQILKKELDQEKAGFDHLNEKSYQYQSLKLDADGNRKLYNDLERKIKETTIDGRFESGSSHVSDAARPPAHAVFPREGLNAGLAFGLAFLVTTAIALIREGHDNTVRDSSQVESAFNADLLAVIPRCEINGYLGQDGVREIRAAESFPPLTAGENTSRFKSTAISSSRQKLQKQAFDESIRMLWSSFQLANPQHCVRSLMMTSAMPEEGKTTLTTRLALENANHKRRTLLIDADLRRPSAHRHAGVPMSPGLANAVRHEADWRQFVTPSGLHVNLDVLPAGVALPESYTELAAVLPKLLAEAQTDYDLVLVDAAPLLAFAEPLHIASTVDGVIVVVCAEKTSRRAVSSMLHVLKRVRANVVGIVLNRANSDVGGTSYTNDEFQKRYNAAA